MHVFLTGEVGVGKSTALARALAMLNCAFAGFETRFGAPDGAGARTLYLRAYGAREEGVPVARVRDGVGRAGARAFDLTGTALIQRARASAPLIVMDELGRLERDALAFQAEIGRCLNAELCVLGVLRKRAGGWIDAVRTHHRVTLIEVTHENRDAVPALVFELLKGALAPDDPRG